MYIRSLLILTFSNPDFAATDTLILNTKKVTMSLDKWILDNLPLSSNPHNLLDEKHIAKVKFTRMRLIKEPRGSIHRGQNRFTKCLPFIR